MPALLFLGVAVVSWMRVELQQPGVPGWPAAGASILRLVPADYLVTAGRAPYTAAMLQVALGVSMFLVVVGLARRDVAVPGRVLFSVAAAGLLAAVLSVVAVPVVYFTTGDWNEIDRYISVTRSRGAFHLGDVNAAGSQYVLAALLSLALAPAGRGARIAWRVGQAAIVVALWMSGSRAAMTAGAAGVAVWGVVAWLASRGLGAPRLSPRVLGACAVARDRRPHGIGSPGQCSGRNGQRQPLAQHSRRVPADEPWHDGDGARSRGSGSGRITNGPPSS